MRLLLLIIMLGFDRIVLGEEWPPFVRAITLLTLERWWSRGSVKHTHTHFKHEYVESVSEGFDLSFPALPCFRWKPHGSRE